MPSRTVVASSSLLLLFLAVVLPLQPACSAADECDRAVLARCDGSRVVQCIASGCGLPGAGSGGDCGPAKLETKYCSPGSVCQLDDHAADGYVCAPVSSEACASAPVERIANVAIRPARQVPASGGFAVAGGDGNDALLFTTDGAASEIRRAPMGLSVRLADAADVDGDGRLDLVTLAEAGVDASRYRQELKLAFGTADGGFVEARTRATFDVMRDDIVVGDFDEDGRADVIVTGEHALEAFFGGDGPEAAPLRMDSNTVPIRSLRAVDLDRDGHLDVVGLTDHYFGPDRRDARLVAMYGNGRRGFDEPVMLRDGAYLSALADIDDDGKVDLVTLDDSAVYLSRGLGARKYADAVRVGTLPFAPNSIFIADPDADGDLDLVVGAAGALLIGRSERAGAVDYSRWEVAARPVADAPLAVGRGARGPTVIVSTADGIVAVDIACGLR